MESLRAAHEAVLTRVTKRPLAGLSRDRIVLILRIVYSSDTLRQAAIDYRSRPAMEILAKQMGVPTDDPGLELAVALFATTIVNACSDLVAGESGVRLGTRGRDRTARRHARPSREVRRRPARALSPALVARPGR